MIALASGKAGNLPFLNPEAHYKTGEIFPLTPQALLRRIAAQS